MVVCSIHRTLHIFNKVFTRKDGVKIGDKHISNIRNADESNDIREPGWTTKYATASYRCQPPIQFGNQRNEDQMEYRT